MKHLEDLNLKKLMLYNPYDTMYNYGMGINSTEFSRIRHISSQYKDALCDLQQSINDNGISGKHFYVLSGYSGTGKTTFLYWAKEQLVEHNMDFRIINLISDEHNNLLDADLIKDCIVSDLVNLINKSTIEILQNNHELFRHHITLNESKKLSAFEENREDQDAIYKLFIKKSVKSCLTIYLFLYIVQDILNKNEKASYVFAFDNIDELTLEYITSQMWDIMLSVRSSLVKCLRETSDFEVDGRVLFVLTMRDANFACHTSQQWDRIRPHICNFVFATYEADKILNLRLSLFLKKQNKSKEELKAFNIFNFIINKDIRFVQDILLPLFNYDIRNITQTTLDIAINKAFYGEQLSLWNFDVDKYLKISNDYIFIKRGILINCFVRYLSINKLFDRLSPLHAQVTDKPYCNLQRIVLITFFNKSYPTGVPSSNEDIHIIRPDSFSLLSAYEDVKSIIDPDEFVDILLKLTDLNKSGWSHLITIYGKAPSTKNSSLSYDFEKERQLLQKYKDGEKMSIKDKKVLDNDIRIVLNAAGYIYLRYILPHFEFINGHRLLAGKSEFYYYKNISLCQYLMVNNNDRLISLIKKGYSFANTFTNNTLAYINANFPGYGTIDLENANLLFKYNIHKKPSYYVTLTITHHIGYLDEIRRYAYDCDYFEKETLNTEIISLIRQYIDLLENRIKDPKFQNMIINMKERCKKAISYPSTIIENKELFESN